MLTASTAKLVKILGSAPLRDADWVRVLSSGQGHMTPRSSRCFVGTAHRRESKSNARFLPSQHFVFVAVRGCALFHVCRPAVKYCKVSRCPSAQLIEPIKKIVASPYEQTLEDAKQHYKEAEERCNVYLQQSHAKSKESDVSLEPLTHLCDLQPLCIR